ncbi:MAG: Na+/H+ antiporter NhaA [Actinomycetota bacterium]
MSTGKPPLNHSWIASDRPVARYLARPVREFLDTEAAGGIVLLMATLAAIIWANSPVAGSYERLWTTQFSLRVGPLGLTQDLRHIVNDGLMTVFFFVVGLEIKRELVAGELNDLRRAALPAICALGGMVMPALIYLALNIGGDASSGWAIPMATDIAFAVGVLALVGSRCPPALKVLLLSIAIVDDIGAIIVIAFVYTTQIHPEWLLVASAFAIVIALMRIVRVWWTPAYVVVGVALWYAMFESGVHATLAGVALGLLTPALPVDPSGIRDAVREASSLADEPTPAKVRAATLQAKELVAVGERLEHLLHRWSSFAIVPVFALANAGVSISVDAMREAATSVVVLGVVVGLVVGKLVGISGFAWLAVRLGLGALPEGVGWRQVVAVGALAGIGFTVALFIAELAFREPRIVDEAKIGVLLASFAAALLGWTLMRWSGD